MPQSLAKIYLHAIFATKNHEPVLADGWREDLFRVMDGTTSNLGCQSIIVGEVSDHVHLLFSLGRTISVADTFGKIKSTSSAWVNQTRVVTTTFHWQTGYGTFFVSQSKIETVRNCILRQPEHHAVQSFQDQLRQWLREYDTEWEERYMWN